ncbi:MAG: hypothetical protein IJQ83_07905 [Bacteroidales bacterium]|nr:hypothetical protein [Bacteroidales bacterium]MBQ6730039.1 hypothetical protein [Bacteroidales bacterium]
MKKLALALVCFASVAFFASCQQEITNPEPTVSVITDEGFVKNGDVIDVEQTIVYGFQMASNSQTKKELKQLSVATYFINLEGVEELQEEEIVSLAGKTEYRYVDTVYYEVTTRDVMGSIKTVATVTDVDGKINTATLTLSLNEPAEPLEEADFTWFRHGSNDATGLEEFGLEWTGNGKEVFAIIKPVEGATLYAFDPDTWNEVTTDVEKVAAFTEGIHGILSDFRGVSAWNTKDYNFVIGTLYEGEYHLIHITHGQVDNNGSAGTDITITGKAK